ncbi:hypothetical protein FAI40_01600 [Acetobacteraceae bacterium]|nr:hypothetical protein FAI40_01600 [Acetobacteraceae bacterium]
MPLDAITRLGRRFLMSIGVARLTNDSDFSGTTQKIQAVFQNQGNGVLVREGIQLVQQYGFASRPVAGSDIIVLFLGGNHSSAVGIATQDQRNVPNDIKPGEVCLYHPQTKSRVYLQENGDMRIKPKNGQKIILDGETECTGKFTADKEMDVKGNVTAEKEIQSKGKISSEEDVVVGSVSLSKHKHPTSAPGAPTGEPV